MDVSQARPQSFDWSKDVEAPVSGTTPADRHASATGAQAAPRGEVIQKLLLAFLEHGRLSIAEAATKITKKEGTVCGPWNRMKYLAWIQDTGEFQTYTIPPRPRKPSARASRSQKPPKPFVVRRHLYELTARGRDVARELKVRLQSGSPMEAPQW